MKRLKTIVAACCTFAICSSAATAANDFSVGAKYADDLLGISGSCSSGGGEITVVVMPYDTDDKTLTLEKINAGEAMFNMTYPGKDGSFQIETGMRTAFDGGLYKAILTRDDESAEVWFSYADSKGASGALSLLNGADNEGVSGVISANAEALGVNSELFSKYSSGIGKYIYEMRSDSGYTLDEFLNEYTAVLAISMVKDGSLSLSDAAEKLAAYLNIDVEADYAAYPDAVRHELERLVKLKEIKSQATDFYRECLLLARINKAESDIALESILLNNSTILGLDMTKYNALGSDYAKTAACGKLLETDFSTYTEVADAFKTACSSQTSGDGSENGSFESAGLGGSGGGGGGGSIGGETTTNPPTNEPAGTDKPSDDAAFSDISGHWAKEYIEELASKGAISGFPDGSFMPEQLVTRAEFSKILCLALDFDTAEFSAEFSDVSEEDWFFPYVLALVKEQAISGYDGKFSPNEQITRQDAAVIMWRILQAKGAEFKGKVNFADTDEISEYAKEAVEHLAGISVLSGYDGRFAPLDNLTRAEAAAVIQRAAKIVEK